MDIPLSISVKKPTRGALSDAVDTEIKTFTRGDAEPVSLYFNSGEGFGIAPAVLPGTPEIKLVAKRVGDYGGKPAVVLGTGFVYDEALKCYTASPDFGTAQMAAAFVTARDTVIIAADTTLSQLHEGKLVVVTGSADVEITVAHNVFANGEKVFVLNNGTGTVTLATDNVTLTDDDDFASGIALRDIVRITFASGGNAATVIEAPEERAVALNGEVTWRDAATSSGWSTIPFSIIVNNEVYRGDEASPMATQDADDYWTKDQADARFLQAPLDTADIGDGEITEPKMADNAASTRVYAAASITEPKMADNAASTRVYAALSITEPKLADNAATTRVYADASITAAKLAAGARALPVGSDSTATSYTPVIGDADTLRSFTASSAVAVTIPLNASVAYPIGTRLLFLRKGTGQVTLGIAAGGTLYAPEGIVTVPQYGTIIATKIASDVWLVGTTANDRAFEITDADLVINQTLAGGGVAVKSFYGLPGMSYNFRLEGSYISNVNTEALGLYFEVGTGVLMDAAVTIQLTAAGAVHHQLRSTAATNIGTPVISTATAASGAAQALPFRAFGRFTTPDAATASDRLFRIKACTETAGANSCTLKLFTLRIWPQRV